MFLFLFLYNFLADLFSHQRGDFAPRRLIHVLKHNYILFDYVPPN